MLRTDRVEQITTALVEALRDADLEAMAPPTLRPLLRLARSVRMDPIGPLRDMGISFLSGLPAQLAADPAQAERTSAWLVHLVAWLDGQTDEPPPDLGAVSLRSDRATA
jgi:hypothetical protein